MQIPKKKNRNCWKSRANSRNLQDPFLRSRKEENLYGHCAMKNAQSILSRCFTLLRVCWFLSKKLHFRKNFDENFNAVERVSRYHQEYTTCRLQSNVDLHLLPFRMHFFVNLAIRLLCTQCIIVCKILLYW